MIIVTEIGMNHMGDEGYADYYVDELSRTRPDGLTFQVQTREYYEEESHRGLALSDEYYRRIARRTRGFDKQFGVGLCDVREVPFFEDIGTDFYKVLSKDIGNRELVAAVLATGKPVYVSTGMSSEEEISTFLAEFGPVPPNLSLIHTQLSYDDADTNLRAISKLRERFGVPVAFGLHSTDVHALYASLGFFPSALFFYVKGSRPVKHRDEDHAIPLTRYRDIIAELRRLETMMGDGVKQKMSDRIKNQ
ncbi:MAG: N-acetylneuraminate synthase family protein [Candidatus Paceibacterota bacterium]